MRVIVTGSRDWSDSNLIHKVLSELPKDATVVHGDCRGADKMADVLARELGLTVEPHPASWRTDGWAAGPERNQKMVDLGADRVLAFHANLRGSKGTKDCVNRARSKRIPVLVYGDTSGYLEPRHDGQQGLF